MEIPSELLSKHPDLISHPLFVYLMGVIEAQKEEITQLKSEIRLLKNHSPVPVIPANSNLEGNQSERQAGVKKNSFY